MRIRLSAFASMSVTNRPVCGQPWPETQFKMRDLTLPPGVFSHFAPSKRPEPRGKPDFLGPNCARRPKT
jgi:hypothetical protein